jgi:hypothetical protein
MQPSGWNELEIAVTLPARVYVSVRQKYLHALSKPNDPDAPSRASIPHPMTGRAPIAKRITGVHTGYFGRNSTTPALNGPASTLRPIDYFYDAPADDFAVELAAFRSASVPESVTTTPGTAQVSAPGKLGYKPAVPGVSIRTAQLDRFLAVVSPRTVGAARRADFVGAFAIEQPGASNEALTPKHGGTVLRSDSWWAAGAEGDRLVSFVPTAVQGYDGPYRASAHTFPKPTLVLVRDPHPWLPAEYLPPREGEYVLIANTRGQIERFRPVRVSTVYWTPYKRRELRDTGRGLLPWYEEAESGNFLNTSAGRVAVQVGALAIGVLTGGAALPALGAIGSITYGGSAVAPALNTVQAVAINPGVYVQVGYGGVMTGAAVGSVVAPNPTANALAELAKGSQFLGGLDGILGAIGREIAINLQTSPARRDGLRLQLAQLKAKIQAQGGAFLRGAQGAVALLRAAVTAGADAGLTAGEQAALEIAQRAASALDQLLSTRNDLELTRAAYDKADREFRAWLDAELLSLSGPAPAPAPIAPASRPSDVAPVGAIGAATEKAPPAGGFLRAVLDGFWREVLGDPTRLD